MRALRWINVIVAVAVIGASAATTAKPHGTPPSTPPDGTLIGGCDATLPGPNASACAGYYTGNVLDNSSTDVGIQQSAIASLPGPFTWNGDWNALSTGGDLISGGLLTGPKNDEIDFGKMLYGTTIIGAHFGNIQDNTGGSGNVSVFWLFDFGTAGAASISLDHTRGFSNAALYTTGTPPSGVPEPATWAMMLVGFGAAGAGLRRRRSKERKLQSCRA